MKFNLTLKKKVFGGVILFLLLLLVSGININFYRSSHKLEWSLESKLKGFCERDKIVYIKKDAIKKYYFELSPAFRIIAIDIFKKRFPSESIEFFSTIFPSEKINNIIFKLLDIISVKDNTNIIPIIFPRFIALLEVSEYDLGSLSRMNSIAAYAEIKSLEDKIKLNIISLKENEKTDKIEIDDSGIDKYFPDTLEMYIEIKDFVEAQNILKNSTVYKDLEEKGYLKELLYFPFFKRLEIFKNQLNKVNGVFNNDFFINKLLKGKIAFALYNKESEKYKEVFKNKKIGHPYLIGANLNFSSEKLFDLLKDFIANKTRRINLAECKRSGGKIYTLSDKYSDSSIFIA